MYLTTIAFIMNLKIHNKSALKKWGGRWGLNPRQPESQSGTLPTELRPPLKPNTLAIAAYLITYCLLTVIIKLS